MNFDENIDILEQCEKIKADDQYLLFLNKGTPVEYMYSSYESEFEAYKAARGFKEKTTVVKADVVFVILQDFKFVYTYTEK